jgi:nucleotide-binding universal stress UspA family protein
MARTLIIPLAGPELDPEGVGVHALQTARVLAADPADQVVLLTVVETPVADDHEVERYRRSLNYLDRIAETLPPHSVQSVVRYGDAAMEIVALAAELGDAMIVMASHSRGGARRVALGSVATQVACEATCPVVIVPAPIGPPELPDAIHRLLIPLDNPVTAGAVVEAAIDALGGGPFDLRLVDIVEPIPPRPDIVAGDHFKAAHEVPTHFLARVARDFQERGHAVTWDLLIGETGSELVRHAAEWDVDLIALHPAGTGGFNRCVFGGACESLPNLPRVPVLIVRLDRAASPRTGVDIRATV